MPSQGDKKPYLLHRYLLMLSLSGLITNMVLIGQQVVSPYFLFLNFLFFAMPAVYAFNTGVFPLRYSLLGKSKRMPMPAEKPVERIFCWLSGSYRRNYFGARFFSFIHNWPTTCYVYDAGLAFDIWFCGKVFVPFEHVQNIEEGNFWRRGYIAHRNQEIRFKVLWVNKAALKRLISHFRRTASK